MKKILKASLILSAVLFCGCMFAAVIPVTSTGNSGSGTLRDAISKAQSGDTISFNCSSGDTISITSPIEIEIPITIDGTNIADNKPMTIQQTPDFGGVAS